MGKEKENVAYGYLSEMYLRLVFVCGSSRPNEITVLLKSPRTILEVLRDIKKNKGAKKIIK